MKEDKEKEDKGKKDKENGRWGCPTCKVEADVKDREIHVYVTGIRGHQWPLHFDCEFGKDIDHIDFSKLERVS